MRAYSRRKESDIKKTSRHETPIPPDEHLGMSQLIVANRLAEIHSNNDRTLRSTCVSV